MKIVFHSYEMYCVLYPLINEVLENDFKIDISPCWVAENNHDKYLLWKHARLKPQYIFADYHRQMRKRKAVPDETKLLAELERTFQYGSLWGMLLKERFNANRSLEDIKKRVMLTLHFWKTVLDTERPDFVISEPPCVMSNIIVFLLCQRFGVRYLSLQGFRLPGKAQVSDDFFGFPIGIRHSYQLYSEKVLSEYNDEAVRYLDAFGRKQQSYLSPQMSRLPNLLRDLSSAVVAYFFFRHKFAFTRESLIERVKHRIGMSANLKMAPFYFHKRVDFDTPYYFFPLHYTPEAATDTMAYVWSDQVTLIKLIASSIPSHMRLYVKEHFAFSGTKPLSFYRELRNIRNVVLIHPEVNTFDLIKKAKLVLTITSTVGFEAILLRKPVIVFGNVFYEIFKKAVKFDKSFDQLFKIFQDAEKIEISQSDVLEFLSAVMDAVHEVKETNCLTDEYWSRENIVLMSQALRRHLVATK